jgi:prepilin peptidase CpaA
MTSSLFPSSLLAIPVLLFAGATLTLLAYRDLSARRLPNADVTAYAMLFLLYAEISGMGWAQIGSHAAVGAITFALVALLFILRIIGGGDVKLWSAVMLWAGPQGAITALVIATVCGSLLGIMGWVSKYMLRRKRKPAGAPVFRMLTAKRGVPYGVGLAIAGLHTLVVAGL